MFNCRTDKYVMVHPPNGIQYYGKNRINDSQEQKARRNLGSKSCMEGKQAAGDCMGCYSSYTRHSAAHLFRDTNPCVKPQGVTGTTSSRLLPLPKKSTRGTPRQGGSLAEAARRHVGYSAQHYSVFHRSLKCLFTSLFWDTFLCYPGWFWTLGLKGFSNFRPPGSWECRYVPLWLTSECVTSGISANYSLSCGLTQGLSFDPQTSAMRLAYRASMPQGSPISTFWETEQQRWNSRYHF